MSELGIFIDESGTFEKSNSLNNNISDLYIVSFLFHDKSVSIEKVLKFLKIFCLEMAWINIYQYIQCH